MSFSNVKTVLSTDLLSFMVLWVHWVQLNGFLAGSFESSGSYTQTRAVARVLQMLQGPEAAVALSLFQELVSGPFLTMRIFHVVCPFDIPSGIGWMSYMLIQNFKSKYSRDWKQK